MKQNIKCYRERALCWRVI